MKQGDAKWHETRDKCAVTASRVADAVGVGYNSRQKYWREKTNREAKVAANWRMLEGNRREPWVAELYFRLMAAFYSPVTLFTDSFTYLEEDPRIGGSVDRIVECDRTGERWVLEIKTCPDGPMRTELPVSHNLQMLVLCKCLKLPKAHYIAHSQGQGIFACEVTWEPELWGLIKDRLDYFATCVEHDVPVASMPSGFKDELTRRIKRLTHVKEIDCFTTARLLQGQQQRVPNTHS